MVVFHLFPELALDESMNRNRQVFEKEKRFEPTDTVQVSRRNRGRYPIYLDIGGGVATMTSCHEWQGSSCLEFLTI
jgi:hypothetical protein